MRYISGGVEAKVVMAGAGNFAKQVWPVVSNVDLTLKFAITADLTQLPYQGFDGRTAEMSNLFSSVVFSNAIQPQENALPTYEFRVLDQQFNGAFLSIETVIPSPPKSLTSPSMLVLAAKTDGSNQVVGVEYGSSGFRIVSLLGSAVVRESFIMHTLLSGAKIRVERFLSWVRVFVNDIPVGGATDPSFSFVGAPGIGVFSSAGPNLSTPISDLKIVGGTSLPKTGGVMGYVTRQVQIPRLVVTPILRMLVPGGMSMRAVTRNLRWVDGPTYNTSFTLKMNDTNLGTIGGFDGTAYSISNPFTVPPNAIVGIDAYSNAGVDPPRHIKSGTLEMIPA